MSKLPTCTTTNNGTKKWFFNGKLHRNNGPALESHSGTKYWYINGKLHRDDGPAVEFLNGDKLWYRNNQLHRNDGPAYECANGHARWYINHVEFTDLNEFCDAAKITGEEKTIVLAKWAK